MGLALDCFKCHGGKRSQPDNRNETVKQIEEIPLPEDLNAGCVHEIIPIVIASNQDIHMDSAVSTNEQYPEYDDEHYLLNACDASTMQQSVVSEQPIETPITAVDLFNKDSSPMKTSKAQEEEFAPCSTSKQIMKMPLKDEGAAKILLDQLQICTHCAKHPDNPVKCYCEEDKDFCCEVCVSYSHSMCKNIKYIKDNYTQVVREMDIHDVKEWINKVHKMIEEGTTSINQTEQEAKSYLSNVEKLITAQKKEGKVFTNIKKKVNSENVKVISALSDRIFVLSKLLEKLYDCLCLLENVNLSPTESIIARHKLLNFAEVQFDASRTVLLKDIPELKISIQEHKVFEIFSKTRLGVSIKYKKPEVSEYFSLCNDILTRLFLHLFNKPMAQIARDPLISCMISFVASANRSNIQAGNYTSDGTYLPDNTILLCDTDSNQLIKLDENLGFLEKLPVSGKPFCVCVSSDGNCVHVVCDQNKVVSSTLQGPWREVHRFGTERDALGIACHGDRIVTGHGNCVVIYDSKGTKLSRINTAKWSEYPALSQDGRMLYHVEGVNDVVCRSMEDVTQEVWRYLSWVLTAPSGIDTDRDGNILIVGGWSDIHQVSGDGKIKRIVVNKMKYMEWPWRVFTNRNNNTFCVISGSWDDKVCVEMYRFDD